jgi:hypothetical protein
MTPDELRRMDNDLCIIYEKGLKPIKANKYYYFKYPEGKLVTRYKADHNDVHIERGVWRKYNPYNPYVEGQDENSSASGGAAASLESLDDLFADEEENVEVAKPGESVAAPKKAALTAEEQAEEEKRQAELIDIQKELEAKFDELFGSIDSED